MDSCNYWKLDKIDKLFISFLCIIVSLFSIIQCFADESETVDLTAVRNLYFGVTTPKIIYSDNNSQYIRYCEIEPGYQYTVVVGEYYREVGFSNSLPDVGVSVYDISKLQNDTFVFNGGQYNYLYFNVSGAQSGVTITRVPLEGYSGTIDNLVASVSPNALWNTFSFSIPYILVVVVAVLGFYIIRKMIKGLNRGKGRF